MVVSIDLESKNPIVDASLRTDSVAIEDEKQEKQGMNKKKRMLLAAAGVCGVAAAAVAAVTISNSSSAESGDSRVAGVAGFPEIGGAIDLPIDTYLERATKHGLSRIEDGINPPGSYPGSLLAALSGTCPNYTFTWARDQALVYTVILNEYKVLPPGAKRDEYEGYLKDFAAHTHGIWKLNSDPLKSGSNRNWSLAEAKHNVDATMFTDPWCSPQNDGPALRSIVLMEFAEQYMKYHSDGRSFVEQFLYKSTNDPSINIVNPIKRDLEYLYNNWDIENCEPWEEVKGKHFYNRIVARRAFARGAKFARLMGDNSAASAYESRVGQTEAIINSHWKPALKTIQPEENNVFGRLSDVQSILATMHSHSADDGFWGTTDSRTFANALYTIKSFDNYFTINHFNWANQPGLGVAIGRYTFDTYNGGNDCNLPEEVCPAPCGGQPWFLATNGVAEFIYKAAVMFKNQGSITIDQWNHEFFEYYGGLNVFGGASLPVTYAASSAEYQKLMTILIHAGDSFIKRTQYHTDENFRLDEQFNADTGIQMSAADLTWAYASLITANDYRKELNPSSLIPGYTGDKISAHVDLIRVPLNVKKVVLVGDTPETGNGDPCNGVELSKRREVFGSAEYSAFVDLPKNKLTTLKVAQIPAEGCAAATYPVNAITIQTSSVNSPDQVTAVWCSTPTCETPAEVDVEILVIGVPDQFDTVRIAGAHPNIGNWGSCLGPAGVKQGPGEWLVKARVPTAKRIEYKAVGLNNGNCAGAKWEEGENNFMGFFFEDTTEPIVNIWECPNCKVPEYVSVRIVTTGVPSNAVGVRIVGNIEKLGQWNACNAVQATKEGDAWVATIELETSEEEIKFKALAMNDNGCDNFVWEPNADNTFFVTESTTTVNNPWGV